MSGRREDAPADTHRHAHGEIESPTRQSAGSPLGQPAHKHDEENHRLPTRSGVRLHLPITQGLGRELVLQGLADLLNQPVLPLGLRPDLAHQLRVGLLNRGYRRAGLRLHPLLEGGQGLRVHVMRPETGLGNNLGVISDGHQDTCCCPI